MAEGLLRGYWPPLPTESADGSWSTEERLSISSDSDSESLRACSEDIDYCF